MILRKSVKISKYSHRFSSKRSIGRPSLCNRQPLQSPLSAVTNQAIQPINFLSLQKQHPLFVKATSSLCNTPGQPSSTIENFYYLLQNPIDRSIFNPTNLYQQKPHQKASVSSQQQKWLHFGLKKKRNSGS